MEKTIIENFEKNEKEIKVALINEIKEELIKYGKKITFENEDEEIPEELEDKVYCINPIVPDRHCMIDISQHPIGIDSINNEIRVYVAGQYSCGSDKEYYILDNNTFTVYGLFGLLTFLQSPIVKELNK